MRKHTTSQSPRKDVYEIITDRILALLDQGTIPWCKPWRGGVAGMPKNGVSKKPYRGINVFMLSVTAEAMGYESPYWLSYKQAQDLGGYVRPGEKSTPVVFWKWLEVEKTDPDTHQAHKEQIPFLRYYNVFNADQCENLNLAGQPAPTAEDLDFSPLQACENIIGHFRDCPAIFHDGHGRAYYRPLTDDIHLPAREKFASIEEYYSTLFHEITHSTGHESRLNRLEKTAAFGSGEYSKEELIAEMGAAFLCGFCGIENQTLDNSAAYIDGWRKKLKADKRLVVQAAAAAQKAVDYVQGEKSESQAA